MSPITQGSPITFIRRAGDVATFYGFRPIKEIERGIPATLRPRGPHTFATAAQTCAALMQARAGEPVLAFYATPSPTHLPPAHLPREIAEFGLQVIGSPESIGEVIIIKTLFAILTEWGVKAPRIRINALGDRDSKARFERELTAYLRRHAHELDDACRARIGQAPCATYTCTNDVCREVLEGGPRAMNFLSEKSRAHFREVLEHIEGLGFPYELDDLLVGDEREPRILFAIDLPEGDGTIMSSVGGRYDEYLRRTLNKKDTAAVSASIFFRKKGADRTSYATPPQPAVPKVYFVQLGLRAKLQGLAVVDMLRQAQVPMSQSFDAKSLAPQLANARQMGVSHLLIMGQREALDGTIILRSTTNSSQTTLRIDALPRLLKTLR